MREPEKSRLRQLLDRPEARPRVSRAVASLLVVGLVSIAAIGALTIWHLVRRGRLIQARLAPPRDVRLPDAFEDFRPHATPTHEADDRDPGHPPRDVRAS
ncbi:MAG: hypothetical protein U0835_13935 [Isosphaeraceae bacterium]